MRFHFVDNPEQLARIRVIGVGGGGGNAVDRMRASELSGVEFVAVNTDKQALDNSRADVKIQIGSETTRGLGSGGNPQTGKEAICEDNSVVKEVVSGCDMIFVTAGMGGGTGTGAAPEVARLARQSGALTIGIVTKPFHFESKVRCEQAENGLKELQEAVDTLIVIPNDRLLHVAPNDISMQDAFKFADSVLYDATRGIYDLIMKPHQLNLDFADVRSVMADMGVALMGVGSASGEDRAENAAKLAISSPLLEDVDIAGSKSVLVNIVSSNVGLHETSTVMTIVQEAAGDQAHVIFGYGIDEDLGEELKVTVIATGFSTDSVVIEDSPVEQETVAEVEMIGSAGLKSMAASAGSVTSAVIEAAPVAETPPPSQSSLTFSFADDEMAVENVEEESTEDPILPLDILPAKAERPAAKALDNFEGEQIMNRKAAFRSDGFIPDLNEPAYTRKYQD
ncbi:MAG: cell division protein FtsZ [bacterium]|nr:cell division protein FtsZ [bacterium]MCP4800539.1 cell division protein FtsZ [bacterium]